MYNYDDSCHTLTVKLWQSLWEFTRKGVSATVLTGIFALQLYLDSDKVI